MSKDSLSEILNRIDRGLNLQARHKPETVPHELLAYDLYWLGTARLDIEQGLNIFARLTDREQQVIDVFADLAVKREATFLRADLHNNCFEYGDITNSNTGGKAVTVKQGDTVSYLYVADRDYDLPETSEIRLRSDYVVYCNKKTPLNIDGHSDDQDLVNARALVTSPKNILIAAMMLNAKIQSPSIN
ncbi:MAG: hypothetical protein RSG77_14310 [Hafnia sp.]